MRNTGSQLLPPAESFTRSGVPIYPASTFGTAEIFPQSQEEFILSPAPRRYRLKAPPNTLLILTPRESPEQTEQEDSSSSSSEEEEYFGPDKEVTEDNTVSEQTMADLAQREKWNTLTDAAAKEVQNEKVLKILSKIERFDEL
uniref:Uncharacterized protein n=1 Tax=Moniliophthora roreri TaxID=221103 RepID=A0A0W0GB78_MONRR